MALDRTWYNSLVNDDGSGKTGTIWRKEDVGTLMSTVDLEIARLDGNMNTNVVQYLTGVSGVVNDLQLLPYTRLLVVENTAPLTITGISAGSPGQSVVIIAASSAPIYLPNRDSRSLLSSQLLNTVISGPTPLAPYFGRAEYVYDNRPGNIFWRFVTHTQGQSLQESFDPLAFTANNGGAWNVLSSTVGDLAYNVVGKTLSLNIWLNATGSALAGPAPTIISMQLPNGYQCARTQRSPSISYNTGAGVLGTALAATTPGSTKLDMVRDLAQVQTWPSGNLGMILALFIEIV